MVFTNPKPQTSNLKIQRWAILFLASLVMMMGYVFWDIVSPVSSLLKAPLNEGGMAWTSAEYGFYAGSYSIFNIFLLMLFFGGIILDKAGIRLTGLLATGSMLLGAVINYYALTRISPTVIVDPWFTLFGLIPAPIKLQVLVSSLGFALFGMGCDITGITVSKIITKWFTGHELASAMGIQVAMARLGTASALSFSPLIAQSFGLSASVLAGVGVLLLAFVLFIIYCPIDRRFDRNVDRLAVTSRNANRLAREGLVPSRNGKGSTTEAPVGHEALPCSNTGQSEDDSFHFHDFVSVLRNPGFWLIALLCVFFYSSIRPFMKFATDLLVNDYGVSDDMAGWIVAAIPYGTIVLTPLFGAINDRRSNGPLLMVIGCVIMTVSHLLLAFPISRTAWYSLVLMVFEGIAFSLVPSALWPQVPKLVPLKQLGTAYSIIYYIQNIGLMTVPVIAGHVIDNHTASDGHIDYTVPMLLFATFGIVALFTALLLMKRVVSQRDTSSVRA